MSAPLLWILFPTLTAGLLYVLRRWERILYLLGVLVSLGLAWLAWILPIGEPIDLGPLPDFLSFLYAFQISDTMTVLGRQFILTDASRPLLILIYLGIAFWFGGAYFAGIQRLFIPLGLAMAALLTAALAVEPFLYAALLIEMAVLLSAPILSPPGERVGRGVLRYITFQTMGMPFILFTGWLIGAGQLTPDHPEMIRSAIVLMMLGFAFLVAIFPFHSWIPMLAEESHPYAAAFIFFLMPTGVSLFMMEFLNQFTGLSSEPVVHQALLVLGILMVFSGGLWAAFQRHLGRIMGYAVIVETGFSLLALSLSLTARPVTPAAPPIPGAGIASSTALGVFFALFLPRALSLGLWGFALSALHRRTGDLQYRSVQGLARTMPLTAISLLLAHFSLTGFPLLAGFPTHMALWMALAKESQGIALLALLGSGGLMTAGLRTLAVLVMGSEESEWQVSENRYQSALLSIAAATIIALGLFPQWVLPAMNSMMRLLTGG